MLIINYEHTSSEDSFGRKYQANISPSDQSFEKHEEELIELKEEHHYNLRNISSGPIQNEALIINYEHTSSEDHF